jgi:uncharacterized protein YkwD
MLPGVPVALPPPEAAIVRAVNVQRAAHGLPALRAARKLSRVAETHSVDQLRHDILGHHSSDGTPFARRIARAGAFRTVGEVIAFAPSGARTRGRTVVRMWMRSPAHRAQLLNPAFRLVGVGRVRGALGRTSGAMVTADLAAR